MVIFFVFHFTSKTARKAKHSFQPAIPDMTPIPFTGERERERDEFDVDITEEEMNNNMKDINGTI